MKRTIIEAIALVFVILFLYTGINKFMDYYIFKEQIALTPILSQVASWIAIILPSIEIIVSVILFLPKTRIKGLYASLILMLLFIGYIVYILNFNEHLPCSCGGFIQALSWKQHLWFNGILTVLLILAIYLSGKLTPKSFKQSFSSSAAICILFICLFGACKRPTMKTGLEGKSLPAFSFMEIDSISKFSTAEFLPERPVVLFYFSPHCPYCRAQISEMSRNMDMLKNMQICMITDFPPTEIKLFVKEFSLSQFANIKIGYDPQDQFAVYFKVQGVPYTAIYGKDRKLKGTYLGPAISHDIAAVAND
jgi:thiol-disulfide isomerase/thioredoxin